MSWEIFLGIVALISFIISVCTPLIKLTKTMTELNFNVKELNQAFNRLTVENSDSHKRIWTHNDEQDERIENHEKRISTIETKMDFYHNEK